MTSERPPAWPAGVPIVVELRIEYPPAPESPYGGATVDDIVRLRDKVDGPAGLVAQLREYTDQVAIAWALEGDDA